MKALFGASRTGRFFYTSVSAFIAISLVTVFWENIRYYGYSKVTLPAEEKSTTLLIPNELVVPRGSGSFYGEADSFLFVLRENDIDGDPEYLVKVRGVLTPGGIEAGFVDIAAKNPEITSPIPGYRAYLYMPPIRNYLLLVGKDAYGEPVYLSYREGMKLKFTYYGKYSPILGYEVDFGPENLNDVLKIRVRVNSEIKKYIVEEDLQ